MKTGLWVFLQQRNMKCESQEKAFGDSHPKMLKMEDTVLIKSELNRMAKLIETFYSIVFFIAYSFQPP